MKVITRIRFFMKDDETSGYETLALAGGAVDASKLEYAQNPIEELALGHYGAFRSPRKTDHTIPSAWSHVPDETILGMMVYHKTTRATEAIWQECLRYAAQDFMRLKAWEADEWHFIGVYAKVFYVDMPDGCDDAPDGFEDPATEKEQVSTGVWGVESDSDPAYLIELGTEQATELCSWADAECAPCGWDALIKDAVAAGMQED